MFVFLRYYITARRAIAFARMPRHCRVDFAYCLDPTNALLYKLRVDGKIKEKTHVLSVVPNY